MDNITPTTLFTKRVWYTYLMRCKHNCLPIKLATTQRPILSYFVGFIVTYTATTSMYVCRITTPMTKVSGSPASSSLIAFALWSPLHRGIHVVLSALAYGKSLGESGCLESSPRHFQNSQSSQGAQGTFRKARAPRCLDCPESVLRCSGSVLSCSEHVLRCSRDNLWVLKRLYIEYSSIKTVV